MIVKSLETSNPRKLSEALPVSRKGRSMCGPWAWGKQDFRSQMDTMKSKTSEGLNECAGQKPAHLSKKPQR